MYNFSIVFVGGFLSNLSAQDEFHEALNTIVEEFDITDTGYLDKELLKNLEEEGLEILGDKPKEFKLVMEYLSWIYKSRDKFDIVIHKPYHGSINDNLTHFTYLTDEQESLIGDFGCTLTAECVLPSQLEKLIAKIETFKMQAKKDLSDELFNILDAALTFTLQSCPASS
jgi:hypothetical protein